MQHDVFLPAAREEQLQFYTCGAACINMVLSRWGKNRLQADLWLDIQSNTAGARPVDAPTDAGSFASQSCDRCSTRVIVAPDGTTHGDYACWYTTPEAMAATISSSAPVAVSAEYLADGAGAVRRIAESLATFDVSAVFTTVPALHWVVAYGYRYDDVPPAASFVKWNAQYVTGIYVHDPSPSASPLGGTATIQLMTPRGLDALLMSIECGTSHLNQYPVVAGTAAGGGGGEALVQNIGPWLEFVVSVITWLDPRRYLRYLVRRRRPGPPLP